MSKQSKQLMARTNFNKIQEANLIKDNDGYGENDQKSDEER
jgi:hypothetical protein